MDTPSGQAESSLNALVEIGRLLQCGHYNFTAVTPETSRRNRTRDRASTSTEARLREAFGWNLPFLSGDLPAHYIALLQSAGALKSVGGKLISTVRYSTLSGSVFVHSGYPTLDDDSVFFGPDSYRFTSFIARQLATEKPPPGCRIVDIGCGSGVGGIIAGQIISNANIVLADINRRALRYAKANAILSGLIADFRESDILSNVDGMFDLIIANPPYMVDARSRIYRHGGAHKGAELSLRILEESIQSFSDKGRLLLYTGTAVIGGRDTFLEHAKQILLRAGLRYDYEEIDPDVFGEELDEPAYVDVERIAAVGLVVHAR